MIANYTTSVSVHNTVAAMSKMLSTHGATSITQTMEPGGRVVGLEFGITTEFGWRPYRVPVRADAVHTVLKEAGPVGMRPSYRTREHADRVAWRIAHDWLRAQLALIEAGMASLPEIMFPFTLVSADKTAFEMYAQKEIDR
jgi:hypothetical protein